MKFYFIFNLIEEKKQKILFVITRMKNKTFNWIKLIIINYLHRDENLTRIFLNFDKFKKEIRAMFEIINEMFISKKIIQYLTQKTFTINYAQRFKKHANKIK